MSVQMCVLLIDHELHREFLVDVSYVPLILDVVAAFVVD